MGFFQFRWQADKIRPNDLLLRTTWTSLACLPLVYFWPVFVTVICVLSFHLFGGLPVKLSLNSLFVIWIYSIYVFILIHFCYFYVTVNTVFDIVFVQFFLSLSVMSFIALNVQVYTLLSFCFIFFVTVLVSAAYVKIVLTILFFIFYFSFGGHIFIAYACCEKSAQFRFFYCLSCYVFR